MVNHMKRFRKIKLPAITGLLSCNIVRQEKAGKL